MTLAEQAAEILGEIFKKEFVSIYDTELADSNFLNSDQFSTNEERATAALTLAIKQPAKKLGIWICEHRKTKHNEDTDAEKYNLLVDLKAEYIREGELREWWNN